MTQHTAHSDIQPWYRQGWPWLLISLPASAVVGGIITIILAVQSPNALVVDDYYKEGLAINQQKQRLRVAADMQLAGLLRSDGRQLTVELSNTGAVTQQELTLHAIHATRAELDRSVILRRNAEGTYTGEMPALVAGNWYLRLQAADMSWEIRSRAVIDGGAFQSNLTAQD